MEVIAIICWCVLLWLVWQLWQARRFNTFKKYVITELKPKVIEAIKDDLLKTRTETFPNNSTHQEATILYWSQYPSRVVQSALEFEVITEQWLKESGNLRHCQHLFHIEQSFMHVQSHVDNH